MSPEVSERFPSCFRDVCDVTVSLSLQTPLHVASEKAHNDVIEVLVKHEVKVSERQLKCVVNPKHVH